MRQPVDRGRRIVVVPSETEADCYGWVIQAHDGRCLARSPYAFATEEASRLSAACWDRELENEDRRRTLCAS